MIRWWETLILAGAAAFLAALSLSDSSGFAQDIPAGGQPTANFYHAQGNRVRVEWKLDRTVVPEDEEIVATLVITGASNPGELIRPDLSVPYDRKLANHGPDRETSDRFVSRFIIQNGVDPAPAATAKEVRYTYRLRPRSRAIEELPGLPFYYHNRSAPEGRQFPLTTAKPVPIKVTEARPKAPPLVQALEGPERLFEYVPGEVTLKKKPFPAVWGWLAAALFGPVAAIGWYVAWRRVYPDAARLARRRRSRAARRAVEAIRRAGREPEPPAAVAAAVLGYLRARFPISPAAATPGEIHSALVELGHPAEEAASIADFFHACDAARFAPTGDRDDSLAARAEALVARLEAA